MHHNEYFPLGDLMYIKDQMHLDELMDRTDASRITMKGPSNASILALPLAL